MKDLATYLLGLVVTLGLAQTSAWGGSGKLLRTFLNPTPEHSDLFGHSVAGVGGNVLVGAPGDSSTGAVAAGSAYLFDASTGALLRTFLNPTPASYDLFGYSVANVGGNVLVGARADDTSALNSGSAYLFDASTGALLQTFLNPTPGGVDYFGYVVAGAGGNALIGAPYDDTGASNAGAAYLFDASTGQLLQTFLNPVPHESDYFGHSVASVDGNVLVGSYLDDTGAMDSGVAYLFDASTGALLQTFVNPTPGFADYFGYAVAGVGGDVVVGAHYDDTGATNAGAAYQFDASTGALLQTLQNPTPTSGEKVGGSLTEVDGNILIGAIYNNTGATSAGAAYLLDASTGALLQTYLNPTPGGEDFFGFSLAAVGTNVLIGSPWDDTGAIKAGAVYLFVPEPMALVLLGAAIPLMLRRRVKPRGEVPAGRD